jgi:hypothetical protein
MMIRADNHGGRVLRRDWFNGGKWQWKYFDRYVGRWFDFGKPYDSYDEAMKL